MSQNQPFHGLRVVRAVARGLLASPLWILRRMKLLAFRRECGSAFAADEKLLCVSFEFDEARSWYGSNKAIYIREGNSVRTTLIRIGYEDIAGAQHRVDADGKVVLTLSLRDEVGSRDMSGRFSKHDKRVLREVLRQLEARQQQR